MGDEIDKVGCKKLIKRFGDLGTMVIFRGCPTFYTLCTSLILGPLSTNSAMSKERYLIA
jgi:hypothetical protein